MEAALTAETPDFGSIAWQAPWLDGLRGLAQPLANADWRAALNRAAEEQGLSNHLGLPLRFVPQRQLPPGVAYEAYISQTGCVPTRANLHDFFNALIWLSYPRIKRTLNALQAGELAKNPCLGIRGKARDAATVFDENAALFACADEQLSRAMREHEWEELFVLHRVAFGTACKAFLFGHALLEKLVSPYKAITAHAWVVDVEPAFFAMPEPEQRAQLDARVATQLADGFDSSAFCHLPVLGIPGWSAQQDAGYYADRTVFRPKRNRTTMELQ